MTEERCKQQVRSGRSAWHFTRCSRPAITVAGYCRLHDPELREQRRAKRPPTKLQRQDKAWAQLKAVLETLDPDKAGQIRVLLNTYLYG